MMDRAELGLLGLQEELLHALVRTDLDSISLDLTDLVERSENKSGTHRKSWFSAGGDRHPGRGGASEWRPGHHRTLGVWCVKSFSADRHRL